MKANEFTSMSKEQLTEKVAELKKDLFTLRFQLATGQLQNTMQITAIIKRAFLLIIFQYLNYHSDFRAQRYKKDGYVNV